MALTGCVCVDAAPAVMGPQDRCETRPSVSGGVGGLCPDGFSWGGWCLLTRHCRERERDCENKKDPERAREREGDKPRNTRQDGDTVKHCAPLVVSLAAFFPCWLLRSLLVVDTGGRVVTRDSASACVCVYCDEQRKCLFFFSPLRFGLMAPCIFSRCALWVLLVAK